jgi:hypothetical protein
MIGLDTNVLLRYLLQDDEVQGERASRAISQAAARNERQSTQPKKDPHRGRSTFSITSPLDAPAI